MQAEAERSGPGAALYVGVLALVLLLTVIEIAVLNVAALAGVQKALIVVLLTMNFTFSALYSMGLQFEGPVQKVTFGVGVALGLMVAVSVPVLLALGYLPVRGG